MAREVKYLQKFIHFYCFIVTMSYNFVVKTYIRFKINTKHYLKIPDFIRMSWVAVGDIIVSWIPILEIPGSRLEAGQRSLPWLSQNNDLKWPSRWWSRMLFGLYIYKTSIWVSTNTRRSLIPLLSNQGRSLTKQSYLYIGTSCN